MWNNRNIIIVFIVSCFGKKYLHGVSDMGSKLLCRFRSGTNGLNEELGRHSIRYSSKACFFVSVSASL